MHQQDDENQDEEEKNPIYFSFDVWSQWLANFLEDIYQTNYDTTWYLGANQDQKNKDESINYTNKLIFFGKNAYKEDIWKVKYFIHDDIQTFYRNHYVAHAAHILRQPSHYKGLFEILN